MRIEYFPDTDSLYIDLSEKTGTDVVEIAKGIVMDIDDQGHPVGLDIDQASKHLNLEHLDFVHLPCEIRQVA